MDSFLAPIVSAWHAFVTFVEYGAAMGFILFCAFIKGIFFPSRSNGDGWDANNNNWDANDSNSRNVYHYPGPGGSPEEELRMLRAGRGRNSL